MKQNSSVFAVVTAALFFGGPMGVGCGGRLVPTESQGTGGSGGSAGTDGSGGNGGSDTTTVGAGGSDTTTVGAGGSDTTTVGAGGAGGTTGGTGGSGGTTGGTGGSGGTTGGTGGAAGKAGFDGGSDAPITIRCGTSICRPITGGPLGTLPPCCPMDLPNACGGVIAVANSACFTTTPGVMDARCPAVQVAGMALPGCCRPNGLCGASLSIINLGCNDPAVLGGGTAGRCGADGG